MAQEDGAHTEIRSLTKVPKLSLPKLSRQKSEVRTVEGHGIYGVW